MTLIEFLRLPLKEKVKGIWLSGIMGEGEYIECWSDSQIYRHSHYKDNKLNGEYKRWYVDGTLVEHSFYENGNRHGEYKEWDVKGLLYRHCLYENGILIKDYLI